MILTAQNFQIYDLIPPEDLITEWYSDSEERLIPYQKCISYYHQCHHYCYFDKVVTSSKIMSLLIQKLMF